MPPSIQWQWPSASYWKPLLNRISTDYLPYLHQNAQAFANGQKHFDFQGSSLCFQGSVTTHYRVWCWQELQREFSVLNTADQQRVETLFAESGGMKSLLQGGVIESGLGAKLDLPIHPESGRYSPSLRQRIFGQPGN